MANGHTNKAHEDNGGNKTFPSDDQYLMNLSDVACKLDG